MMAAKAIRKRLNHGDHDERTSSHTETSDLDNLNEPLLGSCDHDEIHPEQGIWGVRKQECLHWAHLLAQSISRLGRRIANIFIGFGSCLRKLFTFSSAVVGDKNPAVNLNPLQEERLRMLRHRTAIPFDGSLVDHQDALKQLWRLAFPNRELPPPKSDLWKEMGWQGSDPSTDFRGGGFISLENLIYFAKNYPNAFNRLLHKVDGKRAEWEYPFAIAGINISYMLTQMLELQSGKIASRVVYRFLELLGKDDATFDKLYCVAFQMLDSVWLEKGATYMQFNDVLKATRANLEKELTLPGISSIHDLPAFRMLIR